MSSIANRPLPRNPLGVIALFVLLIEAIATISLKIVADAGDSGLLKALVVFIIAFPCAIAAIFFITLWCKREVLYGPMDYHNPKSFEEILFTLKRIEAKQGTSIDVLSAINRVIREHAPPPE
jgi:hypothetical protein